MGTLRTEPLRLRRHHVVVYEDPEHSQQPASERIVTTSARIEVVAGVLGGLVAIVGLAGALPIWMAMVASILIGLGLMVHGGAIGARWRHIAHGTPGARETRPGAALELLAGIVAVVFAVIAVTASEPATLIGCAVLVVGVALMLAGPEQTALGELAPGPGGKGLRATREIVWSSASAIIVVGLGVAVLGVLSILAGTADMTLALVGLLGAGLAMAFAGAALAQRMIRRLA